MATRDTNRTRAAEAKRKEQATRMLDKAFAMAFDDTRQDAVQLGAMKLFLSKVMPDLKAIEVKADVEERITAIQVQFINPDGSIAEPTRSVVDAHQPAVINQVPEPVAINREQS